MKCRTALVQRKGKVFKIYRVGYRTQFDMMRDLRKKGFKVLKIWNGFTMNEESNDLIGGFFL